MITESDIVTIQFDDDTQEYYISSPLIEKNFKQGDKVKWTQVGPGIFTLTKAEE